MNAVRLPLFVSVSMYPLAADRPVTSYQQSIRKNARGQLSKCVLRLSLVQREPHMAWGDGVMNGDTRQVTLFIR